ncbi:hypothetical protein AB6A40_009026 [Gnathostoma spinigerum]|uniref:DRBM domain-containing protein n=1 Tax=Gnathostoma spinigerum TaxID=75299 RepID=A0ABD6ET60_9BILA
MMQRFDNYGFNPGWSKIPSSDGTVKRPPIMKQDMGLSYAKPEVSSPYMQAKHENQQSTDDYNYGYQDGFYYGFSSSANQSNSSSLKRPYTDYYPMMGYEEPSQGYRNYSDVVGYGYGYNPVLPTRPRATVYSARGRGAHSTLKPRSSIGDQSVKNRFPAPSTFKKPPKVYTTTGKTAAMILNELYPDFKDSCNFTSVQTETKVARFRCSIVVKGQGFEADASNKKLAKQLVCEKALKVLRPDIKLDVTFPESGSEASGRSKNEESKKKKKADPLTTSNSIHDYFLRLCREKETETGVKYNPVFTFTELPAFDTFKPYLKRYRCTLVMKEQRKEYSHEGIGKLPGKNAVIRQALIEVFNVGLNELKAIEKRSVSLRPGKPAQVLLQALNFYGRSMKIEMCKVSSGKTVAGSSERFMAKITIDNNITIEGPVEESPALAKDSACMKVLTEHLELEMPKEEDINLRRAATVLSPCYALHFILSKRNRTSHPDIVYSDPVDISESPQTPPKFKCVLKINGTDTYEGIGSSKKAAKNAVAEHVVRNVLKFDLSENSDIPAIKKIKMDEGSDFCSQICSFVRSEYESICYQQGCPTTSHIAA